MNCIFILFQRNDRPHLYSDTSVLKPSNSHGASDTCPRCGGSVFEAEKVVEKGRAYHRRCFTCVACNRPQDDKLQVQNHATFGRFIGTENIFFALGFHWVR